MHGRTFKPELITRKSYFTSASYEGGRVLQCKGVVNQVTGFSCVSLNQTPQLPSRTAREHCKIPWQKMSDASSCVTQAVMCH